MTGIFWILRHISVTLVLEVQIPNCPCIQIWLKNETSCIDALQLLLRWKFTLLHLKWRYTHFQTISITQSYGCFKATILILHNVQIPSCRRYSNLTNNKGSMKGKNNSDWAKMSSPADVSSIWQFLFVGNSWHNKTCRKTFSRMCKWFSRFMLALAGFLRVLQFPSAFKIGKHSFTQRQREWGAAVLIVDVTI